MRESHELEFAVVCVFVFELRMKSVKLGDNVEFFSVFFPCFPAHLRFSVDVAHRPECPPDDGADGAPYGAPEYATPLPPEQMQHKEYADYPAGHAIILHDKLPNIKDDFLGDCHVWSQRSRVSTYMMQGMRQMASMIAAAMSPVWRCLCP